MCLFRFFISGLIPAVVQSSVILINCSTKPGDFEACLPVIRMSEWTQFLPLRSILSIPLSHNNLLNLEPLQRIFHRWLIVQVVRFKGIRRVVVARGYGNGDKFSDVARMIDTRVFLRPCLAAGIFVIRTWQPPHKNFEVPSCAHFALIVSNFNDL